MTKLFSLLFYSSCVIHRVVLHLSLSNLKKEESEQINKTLPCALTFSSSSEKKIQFLDDQKMKLSRLSLERKLSVSSRKIEGVVYLVN